ncbi:hypothetical protein AHAS_Ahas07G0123200 [Arachis hypogaea]
MGEETKRRRFRLQGLIRPVTKCSVSRDLYVLLRNAPCHLASVTCHLSATSASSAFSVQCKRLNSTDGHKCPHFSRVRGFNVFSIA